MNLLNATPYPASYTLGLDPDGREHLVIVVKGTFQIPSSGGIAPLHEVQEPLVLADTFTGAPGESAAEYECDFAPTKPACDVLLLGSAYAPHGRPAKQVPVALRVGEMTKHFEVVGKRYWTPGVGGGLSPSAPEPFTVLPISYDVAFGGGLPVRDDADPADVYRQNPVGRGHFARSKTAFGQWLPHTQESGRPVLTPHASYRPMSFGPVGRNFAERLRYAGTYDEQWIEEHFPFLPPDFDPHYYQAAPPDQWIPYPQGGEQVQLLHLTLDPLPPFELPDLTLPVELTSDRYVRTERNATADTLLFEPDASRFTVVWRLSQPLQRNIRDYPQAIVGRMPRGWYRARARGKTYYPSLRHLAAANRER